MKKKQPIKQILDHTAALSGLNITGDDALAFASDLNAIIAFAEQLQHVTTDSILPLYHPLDTHQSLRDDQITDGDCLNALKTTAPVFHDDLYWIPKVLDTGK